MRILMVGDVIGRPGRHAVKAILPGLRAAEGVDLVIANGENAAGGRGLTPPTAAELLAAGVDVLTSGNHVWDQKEIIPYLEQHPEAPILRPANYPPGAPGRGHWVADLGQRGRALVLNLCGRVTLVDIDCPFREADRLLATLPHRPPVVIVDMHAEATSEKSAMGWHLDGRVSAVLGTHTHIATADARLLRQGTAFVTDVGMVGPYNSVIGGEIKPILQHFLTQLPVRFVVGQGPVIFNAVLVDVDASTGRATAIRRIDQLLPDAEAGSPD